MNTRFFYNALLVIVGAFLVVASQAFIPLTAAWLAFGVAAGVSMISLQAIAQPIGMLQRGLSTLALGIGAWTVVASLVFAPTTVVWLGFGAGIAFVALALGGLTAHELTTERVVHSLEVSSRDREPVTA